jgi:hypothetical protein
MDAAVWCELLSANTWPVRLIQLMEPEPYEKVLAVIESEELDKEGLIALARATLADAAGRPWWEAERLVSACFNEGGRLLGMLLLAGVRPEKLTLAAFCCAVWAQITKGADATQLMKAQSELLIPPPDVPLEDLEDSGDDMAAMVASLRNMPGARIG